MSFHHWIFFRFSSVLFPKIFSPLVISFQHMSIMIADLIRDMFIAHPGLILGTVIFSTVYVAWTGLSKLRAHYCALFGLFLHKHSL